MNYMLLLIERKLTTDRKVLCQTVTADLEGRIIGRVNALSTR